jgi:hypothetical protein
MQKLFLGHTVGFLALWAPEIIMHQVFLVHDGQGIFNYRSSDGYGHFTAVAADLHGFLTKLLPSKITIRVLIVSRKINLKLISIS